MILRRDSSPLGRATSGFLLVAFVCLIFADIAISTGDPWREFGLLLTGIVTPDFYRPTAWRSPLPIRWHSRCWVWHLRTLSGSGSR